MSFLTSAIWLWLGWVTQTAVPLTSLLRVNRWWDLYGLVFLYHEAIAVCSSHIFPTAYSRVHCGDRPISSLIMLVDSAAVLSCADILSVSFLVKICDNWGHSTVINWFVGHWHAALFLCNFSLLSLGRAFVLFGKIDGVQGRISTSWAGIVHQEMSLHLGGVGASVWLCHVEENWWWVIIDQAHSKSFTVAAKLAMAIAGRVQITIANLVEDGMFDKRVSSLTPINTIGQGAQLVLLLLVFGDAPLVRHIRPRFYQLGSQDKVFLVYLGTLNLVLGNC